MRALHSWICMSTGRNEGKDLQCERKNEVPVNTEGWNFPLLVFPWQYPRTNLLGALTRENGCLPNILLNMDRTFIQIA